MPELEVQRFLRSFSDPGSALQAIQDEPHNIKVQARRDLVLLNYDILSPQSDITDDCRGLMLRYGSWNRVSVSFRRFYNHGEGRAADIDWDTAVAYDKVDGTLIVFYHDGHQWTLQTRGSIDADGQVGQHNFSFRDRVLALVEAKAGTLDRMLGHLPPEICVVCEYVGPYNRIVTYYPEEDLYLLTLRNRETLDDYGPELPSWPFSVPRSYLMNDLDEVCRAAQELPKLSEGYVVADEQARRIKVKNPSYLALHNAINAGNAPTDKNFAALAIQGDTDEIKSHFPEYEQQIAYWESVVAQIAADAEAAWSEHGDTEDRKAFALAVKELPLSSWLFQKHSDKTELSAREWMRSNLRAEKLMAIVPEKV